MPPVSRQRIPGLAPPGRPSPSGAARAWRRAPAIVAAGLGLFLAGCAGAGGMRWPGHGPDRRSGQLADYIAAHYRELGTRIVGEVDEAGLQAQLRGSRVLWLGDHHTDRDLHAWQLGLLRRLVAAGFRPVLGLEAIGTQDRPALTAYLEGRIDLDGLRARVQERWPRSWLDADHVDAAHFRELLGFAREHGLAVFPLEPTPRLPLARRDARIAAEIQRVARAHPHQLLVVVIGHAHLLGEGDLVGRTGLVSTVVAARMHAALATTLPPRPEPEALMRSDAGVLFPPPRRVPATSSVSAGRIPTRAGRPTMRP